jgi:ribose-phosphate pyrophosphokinase
MSTEAIKPYDIETPIKIPPEVRDSMALYSGRVNRVLAERIAKLLGIALGDMKIWEFPNGETFAKHRESLRGKDVYFMNPITWSPRPDDLMGNRVLTPSDALVETLIAIRALRESTCKSINAVIPYMGWSRSDKTDQPHVGIDAKLVAELLETAGITRSIHMDLHAPQIKGFFKPGTVDHIFSSYVLVPFIESFIKENHLDNVVIASPDSGGAERARKMAQFLNAGMAMGDKRRQNNQGGEIMNVIGDVRGKNVFIWDDVIATGGTLIKFAQALKALGAAHVYAVAVHGGFDGEAMKKLEESPIEKIFVTDTMPIQHKKKFKNDDGIIVESQKIKEVSVARLLAEVMVQLQTDGSCSKMFIDAGTQTQKYM